MSTSMHAISPAFALLIALLITGVYMVTGLVAFGYAKPDLRSRARAKPMRFDPWWTFRKAGFQPAGRRLCGLGRFLFVLALLAYLTWAWSALQLLTHAR